jgi:hypothetical protein
VGDDFSPFGIAQALNDKAGMVVLHVQILIDSLVEDVAPIAMLRACKFVDRLKLGGLGPETNGFDLCGCHITNGKSRTQRTAMTFNSWESGAAYHRRMQRSGAFGTLAGDTYD